MERKHRLRRLISTGRDYQELKKTINIIGDKWSVLIIICAFNEPKRFKEIEQFAEGISPRMLTKRLDRLVEQGMLTRVEYKEFPPRTEYLATQKARDLNNALFELKRWASKYAK